jgi:hypothetical protein
MMDTLRSYVHLSNRQAANIVNKWLYKILSPADRFAKFFLIKAALFDCKIRNIAFYLNNVLGLLFLNICKQFFCSKRNFSINYVF